MTKIQFQEKNKLPDKTKKTKTYYDKYLALQNDYIKVEDLEILREKSYMKALLEMKELIKLVKEYNKEHPENKYSYEDTRTFKISKEFVIKHYNLNEAYIFRKAKEELQLKSLLGQNLTKKEA